VKPEGLVVLGKVIEILKTVNDKSIRIEGHTDNKPIVGPLTQRYPTNWELSAGRAINVARYLQKQGIESGSLSAAAFGEFKPVADNATLEAAPRTAASRSSSCRRSKRQRTRGPFIGARASRGLSVDSLPPRTAR